MYKHFFKRLIDIIISLVCLPFLLLIIIIFAPLIWIEDKGNPFYLSNRIGKDCKGFNMIKLRSMKVNAPDLRTKDNETYNADDDPRLTKIGAIIRRLSLDETPQILNVLMGDMSIIGPRPNLNDKPLSALSEIEKKRLVVRPGITGYNQAYYRNSIDMATKFQHDVYYVENISFLMDVRIIFKTFQSILLKKNVYNKVE